VPYGLSLIKYSDPKEKSFSFKGLAFFNNGKLSNAPFTAVSGNGIGLSFSKMENGRPAQNCYSTQFYRNGYEQHVE
jgi:hypothetical protein